MGKRKLERALERYRERHPDEPRPAVRWLPFQLNPDLPENGIPREEYVARKFGSRGKGVNARVAAAGAQVDIPFAYEKMQVQPNTLNAHRLLHYGERAGKQDAVAEELFKAHFLEGANLTDRSTLADVAVRAGMARDEVLAYLAGDADRDVVERGDVEARSAGIGGVPFFIFNRRIGVSGAQDPDTLLDAMEQATKPVETEARDR
ncbi:MAG TPA: DsbA family oxidoreductase [Burkholderiales bacterium]|nr:DsbA family oxidoreductase [Burkholderiales bacterium]